MYFQQFYLTCLSHASYMIGSGGIAGWTQGGMPVQEAPRISYEGLNSLLQEQPAHMRVIDVRRPAEWSAGFTQVMDLLGGFDAWQFCSLPYTREQ